MPALRLVLLAVALLVAAPGRAAPPPAAEPAAKPPAAAPPAAPPAGGDVQVAREVARLLVTKDTWSRSVDFIAKDARARLGGHPGRKLEFPPDIDAKARAEVEQALPYEELIGMHAAELSASYTTPQLNEILTFFRTPTGKRWIEVQPAIYERVGVQAQKRMGEKMPEVMKRLANLSTSKTKEQGGPAAKPKK
jgi:hypothetical protein